MEPYRLSILEFFSVGLLISAGIGFVLGLIPLGFGYLHGKKRLGIIGILVSTIGGAPLGIYFSFPVVAVFMWLIIEKKLARVGISLFVTIVGIALTLLAYLRSLSPESSDGWGEVGGYDPIFLALIVGGILFALVGAVLLVLSALSKSGKIVEGSSPPSVVVGGD